MVRIETTICPSTSFRGCTHSSYNNEIGLTKHLYIYALQNGKGGGSCIPLCSPLRCVFRVGSLAVRCFCGGERPPRRQRGFLRPWVNSKYQYYCACAHMAIMRALESWCVCYFINLGVYPAFSCLSIAPLLHSQQLQFAGLLTDLGHPR